VNTASSPDASDELRRLGVPDAVVIGLGSMIGAGIFAALAPAAHAAGSGLLLGLALAAVVAYCNATSSARLAARYPASGGTYVYGRERLGEFWGYLAGWGFVVGKTASCAAIALTVGSYVWPGHVHAVAVTAVVALTAVNYAGVQKSAWLTRLLVAVVLAVLAAIVVTTLTSGAAAPTRLDIGSDATAGGVLQAAGLLFFAFAGYARIATLGEEVRDPARTIPARSRWRSRSPWSSTPSSPSPPSRCSARGGWGMPPRRCRTQYGPPGRHGWCRSCGSAPRSPRSGRCSR
jgi:APA family basic amino acid/polyamine antiporter